MNVLKFHSKGSQNRLKMMGVDDQRNLRTTGLIVKLSGYRIDTETEQCHDLLPSFHVSTGQGNVVISVQMGLLYFLLQGI